MVKQIKFNEQIYNITINDNIIKEDQEFKKFYEKVYPFLKKLLKKFYHIPIPLFEEQDILQEILISFYEAILTYDVSRKASFQTFLYLKIKTRIKDIYRDIIHLELIKKYILSENNVKNAWAERAQMAYNLLTAHYLSEHLESTDKYNFINSIKYSYVIDEDKLFQYGWD